MGSNKLFLTQTYFYLKKLFILVKITTTKIKYDIKTNLLPVR
jgi:hypothetical protein